MTFSRSDLVLYRIQKAWDVLEDARILARTARWNACINRLYYACFHAVSAILLQRGFLSSKHSGVRGLFGQHFVKLGVIDKETARFYNNLFEYRQESDYTDFVDFEQNFVEPLIPRAESFVKTCNAIVSSTFAQTLADSQDNHGY